MNSPGGWNGVLRIPSRALKCRQKVHFRGGKVVTVLNQIVPRLDHSSWPGHKPEKFSHIRWSDPFTSVGGTREFQTEASQIAL